MSERRSANVIGLGLIGGSISLALRRNGFEVWGSDSADGVADDALGRDIIDRVGVDRAAEITFVATPVNTVPQSVRLALETTSGVVTDVGSVKAVAAEFASDPRYIPGHPMAGSELHGLDGADASMFEAAVWVLTPTESTSDSAFNLVAETVTRLGAEVVA
ncbi:MAG: putative prephenate dehydrogenase, partial [Actinomycetota bacterium]